MTAMTFDELLYITIKKSASDLHLSSGMPPIVRIDGVLEHLNLPIITHEQMMNWLQMTMSNQQWQNFLVRKELNYAFSLESSARFRVNAFMQQRGSSAVFRCLPNTLKTFIGLSVPSVFYSLCNLTNGLILITGATGTGKSTTLHAFIEEINRVQHRHIITLEDPIEILHTCKHSLIQQRDVKSDTKKFSELLRSVLRADPDIIVIGEMRDLASIRVALMAAETGHLVLSTCHTTSVMQTLDRILQVFSPEERDFMRTLLSQSLRAIIAQQLIKSRHGGRVALYEVLLNNTAVSHLIREDKMLQLPTVMQTHKKIGMQTFEQAVEDLRKKGLIY
jgi:twitching motility protein PilT